MRLEGTSLGKVALFGWCCKMGLKRMSKGKSVVYHITIHAPYVEFIYDGNSYSYLAGLFDG